MKRNKLFIAGAVLTAGGLFGLAVGELTVFRAGDPIRSAEVNANFSTLKVAVQALEAPVGLNRLSIDGTPADGKVLKLQGGTLFWGDDLLGGGGAAYSAGAGLALTGTTFSLADGGVTRQKLAASGGTDGQVLKLSGGLLTWGNDNTGAGGGGGDITGVTAGSGLSGGGLSGDVTLSLADNGVTTSRLANGAVTSPKLADGSVSGTKLTDRAVTSPKLDDGAVTGSKLASILMVNGLTASNPSTMGFSFALRGQAGGSVGAILTSPVGVLGESPAGFGILGGSSSGDGVKGFTNSGNAVFGESNTGIGVRALSNTRGVVGTLGLISCAGTYAVGGCATNGNGVLGRSSANDAVVGLSSSSAHSGIVGVNTGGGFAAYFEAGSSACSLATGSSGWNCVSDRNVKEHFRAVDAVKVLEAVAKMPITTWNMKGSRVRQIGPSAQDFKAAFNLGESDRTINNTDAQGVALAAIQGLNAKLEARNNALESRGKALEARVQELESQLAVLHSLQSEFAVLKAQIKK